MDSSCVTERSASEPKQNGDVHTADELAQVSREEGAPEEGASEAPQITEQPTKKKEEIKPAKSNKKLKEEEKKLKLLFRNFEGLETAEAKMEALGRKHLQLLFEHKSTTTRKDELATRIEKVIKERDQLQSDFNKASLAKSKLESLCRELQRHSKLVKEDCQLRAQEEETKRKELSEKFQATINDISEQMQENTKANQQLKIENNDLAARLKGLVEQYEVREEHVEKVLKHKQLELQLAEAKMAQQHLRFNEDKEKTLTEKQMLLQQAQEYKKQCEILTKQEKEMRSQLAIYTERFDEFQKTLNKSNEVFGTFKKEMDKMTKTIKKLEKEKNTWKAKCENGNRSLWQMVNEREKHKNEIAALKIKNEKLENLCRALHKGTKGVEKEIDKVEEAAIPADSCSKTPLVKNETTDCEDTRSSVTEQSPQVSEREDSTEKKEFIDAKEEASRSNLNSTELQVLENKLQNESISDPGDKIKQSERAENGTPGVEAVSGESPLECEEIPNDSEESTEPSKEVPNDTCNNSNESSNHLAEVPGEAVDIEAENEDLNNIVEIESS